MLNISETYLGTNNSRVCTLDMNSRKLLTPFYFPSITSAETRSDITETIDIITKVQFPAILVSCYDLYNLERRGTHEIDKINNYFQNGGITLLDSGEFENYHFNDSWSFDNYCEILQKTKSDFFTSFDKTYVYGMAQEEIDRFSEEYIQKSQNVSLDKECMAICHGVGPSGVRDSVEKILQKFDNIKIVAIPERDCGRTIQEYCQTISKIRQTIKQMNKNTIIHILGCGNPLSITALAYSGADTFDAVDWSRWIIDQKTFEFSNLAHLKLLDCTCSACEEEHVDEKIRSWKHNLEFYHFFLIRLRKSIQQQKTISDFLSGENIDKKVISNLANIF